MIKKFGKLTLAGILAAMMIGAAAQVYADDTTNAPAPAPKPKGFRGTLAAVDGTAKTITVDNKAQKGRVFVITSDTKIMKAGKPATLSDGVVGDPVSGSYMTGADGKMMAKMVTFGAPKKPTTN
jgi:hypothetical protein